MIYLGFIFLVPFSLMLAQEIEKNNTEAAPTETTIVQHNDIDTTPLNENFVESEESIISEPTIDSAKMESEIFEEEEEPAGIDTVSLEDAQGNWLFKRIWWERAEGRYGKIRELVNSIWESRTKFFVQRNELDKTVLDPFYISIGMGLGELQAILNELEEFFHKEREKEGDLNEKERALYNVLEEEQEAFRQLRLDVESITKLDNAIDEALGTLMDQINKARQLEKQAWDNFKEIAHILNDIRARELYYLMDGAGRNIKNISMYLEKDFSSHFTRLISEAKRHVTRVSDQIRSLKEKGVDFKRQVDRIAQQEELEKQRAALEQQEEEEAATKKPKPKEGWWDFVVSIVKWPYNLIFGNKK